MDAIAVAAPDTDFLFLLDAGPKVRRLVMGTPRALDSRPHVSGPEATLPAVHPLFRRVSMTAGAF